MVYFCGIARSALGQLFLFSFLFFFFLLTRAILLLFFRLGNRYWGVAFVSQS